MNHRLGIFVGLMLSVAAAVPSARAACDTTAPSLTGFSFSPSAIDTTSASQTVTCDMTVIDDLAGVTTATCSFQSPTFLQTRTCTATAPSSGSAVSGTFSCSIDFPRYSASGTWTAQVTLGDAVGNSQTILPQLQGLPSQLAVTSDPDNTGPALTSLMFSPTAVNVSASGQNVTCTMTVTDAKSGVGVATCGFQAPDSDQVQGCSAPAPSSGTRNNGTFECTFSMPRYSDAGSWTPGVFLTDLAGNFSSPAASGTLTVTASPEDVAAPSLTAFSFAPTSVSVGAIADTTVCTVGVSDATSGVSVAQCTFTYTDPLNPLVMQSQSCSASTPSSGTRHSGTFECTVTIPRYSAGGLWDTEVELTDMVGNADSLPQAGQLSVDCSGGELETTCRFSSKNTLAWDPIAGASRYNVYRGDISDLTDANMDHLPDGGYGVCQNSADPDLTDTTYIDNAVPTGGFDYLVSYTSGGMEEGLGYNSFGDPRTVSSPCP